MSVSRCICTCTPEVTVLQSIWLVINLSTMPLGRVLYILHRASYLSLALTITIKVLH